MASDLKESSEYDNYLDKTKRIEDKYSVSLASFLDEEESNALVDQTKAKNKYTKEKLYKVLYVHFRNIDDLAEFCGLIRHNIHYRAKEIYFPVENPTSGLLNFLDDSDDNFVVDKNVLVSSKKSLPSSKLDIDVENEDAAVKWSLHWKEMPEYEQENNPPFRTVHVKFRTKEDYKSFAETIGQDISEESKSIWHPKLEITANRKLRWVDDNWTLPRHPVYIISKGRHESMLTSRSLARMRIPHYIIIEPQDEQNYEKALDEFDIREYVTLVIAPFSNHGDGPGRARNYAWDHSIAIGATSHWVLDDNISDFYRLHQNKRVRFESGAGFRAMEDFVDRYENIYIAGPQYRFFIAPDQKYPPFVTNTRIYSTLLIRNDCPHRWRGRYNEDTDICLRVLKDGYCTVQFNAFLQGKAATQTVKGGNTDEFYHKEFVEDPSKIKLGEYNEKGTVNKSKMLVDMHPDVARMVFRYGRWHHWVDYSPFKKNLLKFKKGVTLSDKINNYGMRFVDNFE